MTAATATPEKDRPAGKFSGSSGCGDESTGRGEQPEERKGQREQHDGCRTPP